MVINHVKLYCAYLEEQKHFYSKKFNFKVIHETDKEITLKFGDSKLTFAENRMQNSYYHFAFNIPYDLVETAHKWMKKKVEILQYKDKGIVEFDSWNARSFYFLDPAGNIVEFIGRKNLEPEADETTEGKGFNEKKVLHISEVGIPVFEVSSAFKMLNEKTSVQKFDCDDNTFCACGDDRGLFIVVDKAEKNWFPTDERAKGYPLQVEFEVEDRKFKLHAESGDLRIEG